MEIKIQEGHKIPKIQDQGKDRRPAELQQPLLPKDITNTDQTEAHAEDQPHQAAQDMGLKQARKPQRQVQPSHISLRLLYSHPGSGQVLVPSRRAFPPVQFCLQHICSGRRTHSFIPAGRTVFPLQLFLQGIPAGRRIFRFPPARRPVFSLQHCLQRILAGCSVPAFPKQGPALPALRVQRQIQPRKEQREKGEGQSLAQSRPCDKAAKPVGGKHIQHGGKETGRL